MNRIIKLTCNIGPVTEPTFELRLPPLDESGWEAGGAGAGKVGCSFSANHVRYNKNSVRS